MSGESSESASSDGASTDRIVAVPCEGADVLALCSLATGEQLGEIPVGSHPVHATVHAGRTFVATMGDRAVTAVGPDGEVERIETGVLGPSHFAVANGTLFVSCSAGDVVAAIDPVELELLDRIAVGAEPHELAASPTGDRIYSGSRRDGVVDVVDTDTNERIASVDVGPSARVQGVDLTPDGSRGYAVDQANSRVVAFDPAAAERDEGDAVRDEGDALRSEAPIGADPYDLVVTDDRVFVPGRGDGVVHEFDQELSLRTIHEGFSRPVDLFRLKDRWWVLDAEVAELRSLAGEVITTPAPGLVATPVEDRLVVSHYDDDRVSLVDVGDIAAGVDWTTEVPAYPFGSVVV